MSKSRVLIFSLFLVAFEPQANSWAHTWYSSFSSSFSLSLSLFSTFVTPGTVYWGYCMGQPAGFGTVTWSFFHPVPIPSFVSMLWNFAILWISVLVCSFPTYFWVKHFMCYFWSWCFWCWSRQCSCLKPSFHCCPGFRPCLLCGGLLFAFFFYFYFLRESLYF